MTVGSVPPSLALGTVAPTQPGTAPVTPGAGTGTAGSAQSGATQLPAATTPQSGTPPQAAALTTALDALALKAAAQAALGEGGLALLMADLSQAQRIPGLPAPVQAAINQILAQRAPLGVPPTIADLKTALTQSSASSATLLAASASPNATPVTAGPLANALLGLQQALKNWLANAPAPLASGPVPSAPATGTPSAAPSEAGAPPLLANLAQALRASGLPAPVQAAILQALTPLAASTSAAVSAPVSSTSVPLQAGPSGAAAPSAAANTAPLLAELAPAPAAAVEQAPLALPSGVPAQGPAATAPAVATPSAPPAATEPAIVAPAETSPAAPSLAPTSLAAAGAAPTAPETMATATTPAAANAVAATVLAGLPPSVDPKAVMMIFQQVFKAWFDGTSTQLSSTPAAAGSPQPAPEIAGSGRMAPALPAQPSGAPPNATNAPPPPYRGGPTTAQPAVPASLPANADPVTAGARLLRETNAALAHQELLQIASLPAATQSTAPSSNQNPQWMFEIPFATAQGTAIAQFKVTRDGGGKGKGKDGKAPVWRANFSLDVEPMGPVHAQIVLSGDRTWVSLWAEREESVTRLRQNETLLTSSLKDSNFVAEVAFHAGAPRQPATPGRHFLNRAS